MGNVTKLSSIFGKHFLISSILLLGGPLIWTYYSATSVIKTEMTKSFEHRIDIVGELFDREAGRIDSIIRGTLLNRRFIDMIEAGDKIGAQDYVKSYLDHAVEESLDVFFVVDSSGDVLLNASSPVPDITPVLSTIATQARSFVEGERIAEFSSDSFDVTGLFKSRKIILESGEVAGIVVAGTILNDNLQLMTEIRKKTKSQQLLVVCEHNKIIFSSSRDKVLSRRIIDETFAQSDDVVVGLMADQNMMSKYYELRFGRNSGRFGVILVVKDDILNQFNRSFLNSVYVSLVVFFLFLLLTLYIVKRRIFPSVRRVLDYTEQVSNECNAPVLGVGTIDELNTIGTAMENMVSSMNNAREKQYESDERFKEFVESTDNFIIRINAKGYFVYLNHTSEKVYGVPASDCVGKLALLFIDPRDREFVTEWYKKCLRSNVASSTLENRLISKTGEIRDMMWTVNFHYNDYGRLEYINSIGRDITDRKKTEYELAQLRNYLSNIINSMPSALVGVDLCGAITQWNRKAELTTGVLSHEAIGRALGDLMPRFVDIGDDIHEAIKAREVISKSKLSHLIDGAMKYEDVTVYPLEGDSVPGAVIRIDDVTDRVQLENAMVQSEKMQSLGGLAAGMAHEINNPLGGIMQGYQNILNRLNPEKPKNIKVADELRVDLVDVTAYLEERGIFTFIKLGEKSCMRAAQIVKNMLTFSRKSTTIMAPTNLAKLIDHVIELGATDYDMSKKYDFKFVDIVRDYDPDIGLIQCCSSEIEQVLLNLFKNALQAMELVDHENHRAKFNVRLKKCGRYASIEVKDNGPGIPDDVKRRVFEPFFTTKPVGDGTGLGLSVSYMIITQNHGGRFEVESEVGHGTTFTIDLPL